MHGCFVTVKVQPGDLIKLVNVSLTAVIGKISKTSTIVKNALRASDTLSLEASLPFSFASLVAGGHLLNESVGTNAFFSL